MPPLLYSRPPLERPACTHTHCVCMCTAYIYHRSYYGMHICAVHPCPLCRELKRLSAVTLSPIYAHFTETLTGLQVIRAFRHEQRFARENEERLEVNQRATYACKSQPDQEAHKQNNTHTKSPNSSHVQSSCVPSPLQNFTKVAHKCSLRVSKMQVCFVLPASVCFVCV